MMYIMYIILYFLLRLVRKLIFLLLLFREYDDEFFFYFIIIHFVVALLGIVFIYKYIILYYTYIGVFVNLVFIEAIQGLTGYSVGSIQTFIRT